MQNRIYCRECSGHLVEDPDGSPGVLVHENRAFDNDHPPSPEGPDDNEGRPLIHWQDASCILAIDYDGTLFPGHTYTKDKKSLTCPVCLRALGGTDG